MPSVFDLLGDDNDEVRQMLTELEAGPAVAAADQARAASGRGE